MIVRQFASYGVAVLCSFVLLAGCDKNKPATVGQVVARVGDADITQAEFDNELRLAGVQDAKSDAAKRIAKELVSRKYTAWKAAQGKLDQQPSFVLGMIRSHDQLLSAAYSQREIAVKSAALNASDIGRYIDTHPDRFSKRAIVNVDQVIVPNAATSPSVIEGAKSSSSLDGVADYFTSKKVPISRSKGMIDSAEVPTEFFDALKAREDGHVLFVQTPGSALFFTVEGSTVKPLTGDAATTLARRELRARLVKEEVEKNAAEADALVKYEGALQALMAPTAAPDIKPQAEAAAPASSTPPQTQ